VGLTASGRQLTRNLQNSNFRIQEIATSAGQTVMFILHPLLLGSSQENILSGRFNTSCGGSCLCLGTFPDLLTIQRRVERPSHSSGRDHSMRTVPPSAERERRGCSRADGEELVGAEDLQGALRGTPFLPPRPQPRQWAGFTSVIAGQSECLPRGSKINNWSSSIGDRTGQRAGGPRWRLPSQGLASALTSSLRSQRRAFSWTDGGAGW
jgi:hypothetical protein